MNKQSFQSDPVAPSARLHGVLKRALRNRFQQVLLVCTVLLALHAAYQSDAHPGHVIVTESSLDETAIPDNAVRPRAGARIVMPLRDKSDERIVGRVAWFNLEKLGYIDADEQQKEVAWADLDPNRLGRFLTGLPDRKDAACLLMTAEVMIIHGVQEQSIERLLSYALRADETVAERVEALRTALNNRGAAPTPQDGNGNPGDTPEAGEPGDRGGGRGADGQPQIDNPRAWPQMTDEQHAQAVAQLETTTNKVLEDMNHAMGSTQTERFLVYSDMPRDESRYWVSLLDKMYDRLCEVFDLDKDKNIWKGKCLLLFFNNREDFLRYNVAAYGNNPVGAAGICYQFGNGDVHISMYRQEDQKDLAHVLVHEAVHGFLFRYMSSHYVPNWLNEGLAEYIAVGMVDSGEYPRRANDARRFVQSRGRLDNFLSARNIIGQHYGLAYDVTDLMVGENRKGYVALIQGIKEGLSVEEAFDEKYGASVDRVFQYYANSRLRVDAIRMD